MSGSPPRDDQAWAVSNYIRMVGGTLANVGNCQQILGEYTAGGTYLQNNGGPGFTISAAPLNSNRRADTLTTSNASVGKVLSGLYLGVTNGAAINVTLRIGAPQFEQGGFATSFIPTTGASVTRVSDVATMPIDTWYSATAGTITAEAMLPANGNTGFRGVFNLDGGVTAVWLRAFTNNGTAELDGTVDATGIVFGTMTPGAPFKIGLTYAAAGSTTALSGVMGTGTAVVLHPSDLHDSAPRRGLRDRRQCRQRLHPPLPLLAAGAVRRRLQMATT